MKIVGLIVEYNPFHNGHMHHLNEAKRLSDNGLVIAVTTTYFSMRGEVCVIDKYQKTKLALEAGIDILIELPYLLGTQNADIFAFNAVQLLAKMGVDTIVAGSECNDIQIIKKIHAIEKNQEFQNEIKKYLSDGLSYRRSFSLALEKFGMIELLANDLLNLKYYDAIQKLGSLIELKLIKRINNNYHDQTINATSIQSATALRKLLDIQKYVPHWSNRIYAERQFMNINSFVDIYNHLVITNDLSKLWQATEGIHNRFTPTDSLEELIGKLTSKRYTTSRITRFISYILTNTTTDDLVFEDNYPIRILGFNTSGQEYLNSIKKRVNFFTRLINGIHPIYDFELKIAKIFSNVFKENFIVIEQKLPYRK